MTVGIFAACVRRGGCRTVDAIAMHRWVPILFIAQDSLHFLIPHARHF
jgi:hypothetical protein